MGYFEDVETELGKTGVGSEWGTIDSGVPVQYVGGPVALFTDITQHLTLPSSSDDTGISLLDGASVDIYCFDAENTVIYLTDDGSQKWVHCTKFDVPADYTANRDNLKPDVGLRV